MKLQLVLLLLGLLAVHGTVNERVFLDDNTFTSDRARPSPVDLGAFLHQCLGNVSLCPNGFTLAFWYKPLAMDTQLADRCIISTGGQSELSDGVYMRQKCGGIEHEVGVSIGDRVWNASFQLPHSSLTYVTMTFSQSSGLKAYVDCQLVRTDVAGSPRFHVPVDFDQFANAFVGQCNDLPLDQSLPGVAVWKLTHADTVYTQADCAALSANPANALRLGCSTTGPAQLPASAVSVTDAAALGDISTCRSQCFRHRRNVVVFNSGQTCQCVDWSSWSAESQPWMTTGTCTGSEPYAVTWSTHALFDVADSCGGGGALNVTVSVVRPTSHDYVRPSETIAFHLSTTPSDGVVYHVNFNDPRTPETLITTDGVVAHAWSGTGNYSVNVTAVSCRGCTTVMLPVQIHDVDEGVPPQNLAVKSDSDTSTDHTVTTYLQAYSPRHCSVDYGDQSQSDVFDDLTNPIFSVERQHQYPGLGFYAVSLTCQNGFGSSSETAVAVGAEPRLCRRNLVKGSNLVVSVSGADGGGVAVAVDGATVSDGVTINGTHVVVGQKLLASVGEHRVTFKTAGGFTFMECVVTVETPVSGVQLTVDKHAVQVNETVDVRVSVMTGDNMHFNLSYGDGQFELFYVQSSPVTLTFRHRYSSLCKYVVRLMVANALGVDEVLLGVSVERPILRATMTVTNVKLLGQPTTFTFNVTTAPVTVRLDYGDCTVETVTLGEHLCSAVRPVSTALMHNHTYDKYGVYHVRVTVMNNVSSLTLPVTVIQVGQNVTSVDVRVAHRDWLAPVDAPVSLTVDCPTGWPVILTVDMGDGQPPQRIARPPDYDPATDDRAGRLCPGAATPPAAGRRRRDVQETATIGQPFALTYQYRTSGSYRIKVNVTNGMSTTSSWLCPDITVIRPPVASAPTCQPTAAIVNATRRDNPRVSDRSAALSFTATSQLQCSSNAVCVPRYTWTVERLMSDGQWRPELSVCPDCVDVGCVDLSVAGNTLWYGTYRINVTVTASCSGTLLLGHSTQASTYLTVVRSQLVPSIVTRAPNFQTSDTINLNMTGSRDPDVAAANKSGLHVDVFCYPQSEAAVYEAMNVDEMRASAERITNNTAGTVAIYEFAAHRCFNSTRYVWVVDFEAVFPAANVTGDVTLQFKAFVTKDEREAADSVSARVWSMDLDKSALDSIDELLAAGDVNSALLVIDIVADGLNEHDSQNEEAVQQRTELRGALIGALDKCSENLHNMDQISKTSDTMTSVTSVPDEVKDTDKASAAGALGNAAASAKNCSEDATEQQVSDITESMLSSLGNVLPFDEASQQASTSVYTMTTTAAPRVRRSAEMTESDFEFSGVESTLSNETTCCGNLSGLCEWIEPVGWMCIDEDDRKFAVWTEADCLFIHPDDIRIYEKRYQAWLASEQQAANALKKDTTTSGMGAFSDIGGVLMGKQGDAAPKTVTSPSINMTVMKVDDQSGSGLNMDDYSLPAEALAGVGAGGGFMMVKAPNAYTYSNGTGGSVRGDVKTLSLNGAGGSPMSVSHTDEPFELWMDGASDEPDMRNFTFLSNASGDSYNYHRIEIPDNGTALFATVHPANPVDIYYVYLKYDGFPNETYYDWVGVVPNPDLDEADPRRYVFAPPQNYTIVNGTYRIGIRLKAARIHVESSDSASNYTYGMYFTTAACRFWNESTDAWDTAGCTVGPLTTYAKTQCLCTHLTSFGGDMYVPPNTIDFNTVFTAEKFLESMPVFCTVAGMIAIYLLIIVWARHMDKKDIARWGATPLEDNVPSDSYYYQLAVYTGVRKGAGTRSKPSFIMSGDYADTGVRRLFDGKRKELITGSIMNFIMSTESCLGPLTFLRIWHDNSGHGKLKGWFLDQIQITDLQTGEKFFFICDRWMAVEEDDGMVERILPVAGAGDLTQFKQLFNKSVRKKMTNDHLWVSVFSRPTRSSFTRVQRISCCVALLFLTMITNCMFFKAQDPDHATEVHIGPITLTLQQLYISIVSTLIVFPPSLTIVTIFRKARPKSNAIEDMSGQSGATKRWKSLSPGGSSMWNSGQRSRMDKMRDAIRNITTFHQRSKYAEEDDEEQTGGLRKKKKKRPFTLPHWTTYIAWAMVFLAVTVSGFFTVLYSMEWGHTKSVDWLTTFFLSIVQSIVVVQPVKVLLLAMFLSCILKKPDVDDEYTGEEENHLKHDEEFLSRSERDIQEILKQRRAAQTAVDRPNTDALKRAREVRLKQIEMNGIIKECIVYLVFVLVVYFISYQERDFRSFLFAQNIKNQFFGGKPSFSSISSHEEVYTWINETLIPNLYSGDWYNGEPLSTWREALQTRDRATIRLGIARVRQLRIKDDTCTIPKRMSSVIDNCRDDYNWVDDDTKDYSPGWQPRNQTNMTEQCIEAQDKYDVWKYRNSLELKCAPYVGAVNTYKGGGYTFNFRRDPRVTIAKLDELAANDWLDVRTRAVFVEFTLYNANVNLYGSVIMLIEFLSTGAPVISQEVKVFRLTSYIGPFGIIVIMFQLVFVGFIIYFLYHVINKIRKQKRKYFKSFWNMLELVTVIMAVLTCAMYGAKIMFGNAAMDTLRETGSGEYVNFVTIGIWDETYGFVMALVVFLATLKFINMLKFNRRMGMLTDTIKLAAKDMKAFVITFFIYFFAFSQLAYLLFGSVLTAYSSFVNTIESLFGMALGDFDFHALQIAQPILGPVFFFFFIAIIFVGMQTMFLTIICEAFTMVRGNLEYQKNDYEIVDYVINRFKGLFGMGRRNENPGEQETPATDADNASAPQ